MVGLSRRKNIFEGGLSYADPRVKVPFMDQCEHSAVMPSPIFKFPQWRGFVIRDFPTIGLLFQEKHGLKALKAFIEKHSAWCNRRIVVLYAIQDFDLDGTILHLGENRVGRPRGLPLF